MSWSKGRKIKIKPKKYTPFLGFSYYLHVPSVLAILPQEGCSWHFVLVPILSFLHIGFTELHAGRTWLIFT
jgi:hypothetical protein